MSVLDRTRSRCRVTNNGGGVADGGDNEAFGWSRGVA